MYFKLIYIFLNRVFLHAIAKTNHSSLVGSK